jgi:hypothetical protein
MGDEIKGRGTFPGGCATMGDIVKAKDEGTIKELLR